MFLSICAVSVGAALGALLRWVLASRFNPLLMVLPPGTLAANLLGGYLVGVAVAFFVSHPDLPPQWRLFVITGFLGGLTTFSAFSAEVVEQMLHGRIAWALTGIAAHLLGSLVMTSLGIGTVSLLHRL